MNFQNLHIKLLIGLVLISSFSRGQTINIVEENDLKFQTHFFEALKQKAINNYSKAIESLEKCYEIDSASLAVQFELSKNKLLIKNYFEAQLFIDKAIEKNPSNVDLLLHKIAIFKAQRNYKEAIEIQKRVNEIQPVQSDKLVLLYIQNRDFKKAQKLISEIENKALSTQRIKVYKKYFENRRKLSTVLKKENDVVENIDIESLKKSYLQKKEYKTLKEILKIELKKELFEMLFVDSKNGLELFPAQPYLYKMNGLALNKLGKYNEAINVLTVGIDFVIDDIVLEADFYNQLSKSYEGLNKKNEALKYKQKAEKLRKGIK
ncbi:MAG: hypothetical protein JKY73_00685 [Lutibacter sp.]|nr:hypothetical protein [Lutibacter sp.]